MNQKLLGEVFKNKECLRKLSLFDEKIFSNEVLIHKSHSDSSFIFKENRTKRHSSLNKFINYERKIQNAKQQNNPINILNNENKNFEYSNESTKNSTSEKNNSQVSPFFLNLNFYGFKGRSPYALPNVYNLINNNSISTKTHKTSNNYNKKSLQIQQNDNTNKNKNNNEETLVTQLKDKKLEYRCFVCNFVTNEKDELCKHLYLKKHFNHPKKMKKAKKHKIYKPENKLNQTFVYYISKINKKIGCRYCGKKFDSNQALNAHLNAHKFKCENCFKIFNNKEELIKHQQIETLYRFKYSIPYKKKKFKSPKKIKKVIDDWEDMSSNKNDKKESDEEFNLDKNSFGTLSYAFIGENEENFDFNKMVKINNNK